MKVKSAMSKLSIRDFIAAVQILIIKLTGNLNYPALPYTVAQMTTAVDELDELQDEVDAGTNGASEQRDIKRKEVQFMVTTDVNYINGVAKGDETRLATTGLQFVKTPASQPVPGAVSKIAATNKGETGEVLVAHSSAQYRKMYRAQYTTNNVTGPWIDVPSYTENRFTIEGLTPGSTYYIRVAGWNNSGQGQWSELAKVTIAA